MIRIGHGIDVHRFKAGDFIVIGGVKIPHTQALEAHSDGDVLLHALCDALLGAVALRDIGYHFPDTDAVWRNVDSRQLLHSVWQQVTERNYRLSNADLTLIAQAPRFAPHIELMRRNIAGDIGCDISQINVKATTTEKLGYLGRGEGIAAHAVVLLVKNS